MTTELKFYLYNWGGLNQELSQKLHLMITNETKLKILEFLTTYVGYYKMFPIHFVIIFLIMTTNILISKSSLSQEQLRAKITKYFQLLSTLVITILCMAITIGAAKEIFSLTRPVCTDNFILSEYALQYKQSLKDITHECNLSFPSGHSAYITAMLVALWRFLSKPLRAIGILTISLVAISRVALGMHFIADVCFAIIMSIFIAKTVRHVMDLFFAKRSKKQVKN